MSKYLICIKHSQPLLPEPVTTFQLTPLEKFRTTHQDRKQNKILDSLILSRGVWRGRVGGTDYTSSDPDALLTGSFPTVLAGKCTENYSYGIVTHAPLENSPCMLQILTSTLQYQRGASRLVGDD